MDGNNRVQTPGKDLSRQDFIKRSGALAAAAVVAKPQLFDFIMKSKKVRIGIPLTYGPLNQPWRRGAGMLVKKVLEMGAEPVTFRGEPTKASERNAEEQLLTRGIDALVMGIYQTQLESKATAQRAQSRGIPTVGFATYVYNSPAVVEDQFGTALKLGNWVLDKLQRRGTVVQTAENPGFYQPFDIEVSMLNLMVKWQPQMTMLPFLPGGVSTQNERQLSRQNVTSLLSAHPQKGSVNAIVSWWWPDSLGAADALRQTGRTEIIIANHYFSNELLTYMSQPNSLILASTDTPWHILGTKTAELAVRMARGERIPPTTSFVPVTFIEKKDAARTLADVKRMDSEVIALLRHYGG